MLGLPSPNLPEDPLKNLVKSNSEFSHQKLRRHPRALRTENRRGGREGKAQHHSCRKTQEGMRHRLGQECVAPAAWCEFLFPLRTEELRLLRVVRNLQCCGPFYFCYNDSEGRWKGIQRQWAVISVYQRKFSNPGSQTLESKHSELEISLFPKSKEYSWNF